MILKDFLHDFVGYCTNVILFECSEESRYPELYKGVSCDVPEDLLMYRVVGLTPYLVDALKGECALHIGLEA